MVPELIKKIVDTVASQSHGITLAVGDFNLLMDTNSKLMVIDKQL